MKLDFKTFRALNGLRVAGNMNEDSLTQIISLNRINTLKREGLIKRISYQNKHISSKKSQYTYALTKKGKQFCREKCHMSNFAAGNGMERHNTAVGEIYASLEPSIQITCMNELDLKEVYIEQADFILKTRGVNEYEHFLEKLKSISLVDLTYQIDDEIICIEVSTKNYSHEVIEQKEACSSMAGCSQLRIININ